VYFACLAMPVSSPYALFRAADHAWPPPLRPVAVPPASGAAPCAGQAPCAGRYSEPRDSQAF
jgi:hypothetical protein